MKKNAPNQRNVKRKDKNTAYITEAEFEQMLHGARKGRHGQRDVAIVRLLFQHGLRATELVTAHKDAVKLKDARFKVKRLKGSLSTEHPLAGATLRALKAYLRTRTDKQPWLFISERGAPMTRQGLYYLIGAIAKRAGLSHVHPHMLRHGCGYALANQGRDTRLIQAYLGHRDIQNTVIYTEIAAKRFEGLWEE